MKKRKFSNPRFQKKYEALENERKKKQKRIFKEKAKYTKKYITYFEKHISNILKKGDNNDIWSHNNIICILEKYGKKLTSLKHSKTVKYPREVTYIK